MRYHLHDDNSLLHHIADACSDELEEHVDTPLSGSLNFDSCLTDRFDAFPDEVYIDFR